MFMITEQKGNELRNFASDIRTETINMISKIGTGHVGGSLSIADLMAVLYGGAMKYNPKDPRWDNRDRIVLSKGHAGPAMYAALGLSGFFPKNMLNTLNQPPTDLPSHTDMNRTPGVDMTTGSLGQGASSAVGIALGCKMAGRDNYTYLILGDGECEEGQVWEALMFAAAKSLGHLIGFLDYNKKQLDGTIDETIGKPDFANKVSAFGWNVIDVEDGHDVLAIWRAIEDAKEKTNQKPTMIILNTVKGKGWRYAEGLVYNHSMNVSAEQAAEAAEEFANQRA
jgi:transketolase